MKRIIFILVGMYLALNSYSQDKLLKTNIIVSEYYVDTIFSQIDFCYSNYSDSTFVLWIEKNNVDSLSNTKKIKNHFLTKKGDWSLMQILSDGNVEIFVPGLFDSFFKVIKPNDQFTVTILYKGKIMNNQDLINSYGKRISIVPANEIKGLKVDSVIDLFNFKEKNLTILAEWIK
jgi:hypothetical protein